MQQGFTPSLKTQILQYFFNDTPEVVSEPTPLFLGLFIDQGSAEPRELIIDKDTGYARASIEFSTQPDTGVIRNTNAVNFPVAKQDWTYGTSKITYVGIFKSHPVVDPETGTTYYVSDGTDDMDELVACIQLPEAETVHQGETFQFNPESITLQLI